MSHLRPWIIEDTTCRNLPRLAAVMETNRGLIEDVHSARPTLRAPQSAPVPHAGIFLAQPRAREGDGHGMKGKMVGSQS